MSNASPLCRRSEDRTEQPKPTEQHRRLEKLTGKWIGEEKIQGSPHTSATNATGSSDIRTDLNGLFALIDYVEKAGSQTALAGHGVIGWDPQPQHYPMRWSATAG